MNLPGYILPSIPLNPKINRFFEPNEPILYSEYISRKVENPTYTSVIKESNQTYIYFIGGLFVGCILVYATYVYFETRK